jgi:hypothetical protein
MAVLYGRAGRLTAKKRRFPARAVDGFEDGKVGLAVVFQEMDGATNVWRYAIRANFTSPIFGQQQQPTVACLYDGRSGNQPCGFVNTVPATNIPPVDQTLGPTGLSNAVEGYSYSGFLTLQQTVDSYILQEANAAAPVDLQVSVGLMPNRAFRTDNFFELAGNLLGLFFMLSFIYPVSRFVRAIVLDKEKRVKETMKIMGLRATVIDLAWFLMMGLQMLLASLGILVVITLG